MGHLYAWSVYLIDDSGNTISLRVESKDELSLDEVQIKAARAALGDWRRES